MNEDRVDFFTTKVQLRLNSKMEDRKIYSGSHVLVSEIDTFYR